LEFLIKTKQPCAAAISATKILGHVELGKPNSITFESYLITNRKKNANDNIKNIAWWQQR